MSASGPLSYALRFGKPFIVSKTLKESFRNLDFKVSIEKAKIRKQDFLFSLSGDSFEKVLIGLMDDKIVMNKLVLLSKNLRFLRSWENIVLKYEAVINQKSVSLFIRIRLLFANILPERTTLLTAKNN